MSTAVAQPKGTQLRRGLRLIPLAAATYFMVAGGPYGIEDILGGAGYLKALAILLGPPRHGSVLGLSGGVAFPCRQHLRHGNLSHIISALPEQVASRVDSRLARDAVGVGAHCRVRPLEPARRSCSRRCLCRTLCNSAFAMRRAHHRGGLAW